VILVQHRRKKKKRSRAMMEKRYAGGKNRAGIVLLIATLLCFAYCSPALAECTSTDEIELTVEGGGYTGYCTLSPSAFNPTYWGQVFSSDEPISWYLPTGQYDLFPGGIDIKAENHEEITLAHLYGLSIQCQGDPIVNLGFSVTAGAYATSFSFSSPLMTFDPLINAEAYAEAQIGINSSHTLMGSYSGGKAYKALYNSTPTTTFAYLVNTINSPPWSSWESAGLTALPGTITSMQSKFQFILSAGGMASGSSSYEITGTTIPEPASMLLLGLGGLALLRKRRA
jgi:hypothetical protein